MTTEREKFEAWISGPPYERSIARFSDDVTNESWPGQYKVLSVQLAWDAWMEGQRPVKKEAKRG